jgi:hypothetical protein
VSASSDEAFVLSVLAALKKVRLEAIVVGSVAGILQGSPVTTQDLDLLVRDTPVNRKKIQALATALGARPREISELSSALRIDLPAATVDLLFDQIPGNLTFQALRVRQPAFRLHDRIPYPSPHPILRLQSWHPAELGWVAGDHDAAVSLCNGGDHQVAVADGLALRCKVRAYAGVAIGGGRLEVEHAEGGQELLLVGPGALGSNNPLTARS